MSTTEQQLPGLDRTEPDRADQSPGSRQRGLISTIVVLLVAVAALGGWVVYDRASGGPDGDMQDLLDGYFEGANDYDAAAWAEHLSDDYTFHQLKALPPWGLPAETTDDDRQRVLDGFEVYYPSKDYRWNTVGEPIVIGDGPWLVAQEVLVRWVDPGPRPAQLRGVALLTVVEEGGELVVLRDLTAGHETD